MSRTTYFYVEAVPVINVCHTISTIMAMLIAILAPRKDAPLTTAVHSFNLRSELLRATLTLISYTLEFHEVAMWLPWGTRR